MSAESLKAALRAKREQLFAERTFYLPVLGYEDDGLVAKYRALTYEQLRDIGKKNESLGDTSEGELTTYADTLVNACVELADGTERSENGNPVSLGVRWSATAANEFFGASLPEDATSRVAIRAVLPGNQLALHFAAYDVELSKVAPKIASQMVGEPEPPVGG
jgi:hypothetical protein